MARRTRKTPKARRKTEEKDVSDEDQQVSAVVSAAKILSDNHQTTALIRLLRAPSWTLDSKEAWPEGLGLSTISKHRKPIEPFLVIDRPANNKPAIYTLEPDMARHLIEAVSSLERLNSALKAQSTPELPSPDPAVLVSLSNDGAILVAGKPVARAKLGAAILSALAPEEE